jgi:hypothetical protein
VGFSLGSHREDGNYRTPIAHDKKEICGQTLAPIELLVAVNDVVLLLPSHYAQSRMVSGNLDQTTAKNLQQARASRYRQRRCSHSH